VDDTLADVKRKVQTYGASSRPFRLWASVYWIYKPSSSMFCELEKCL
jgi:hypothetical protein